MVMTFVLHPLSHYNSITEPRSCFLLSLIEDLTIDFPFHFILSLIDVYKDTGTCDKLIFPSGIMRIICHSSVSYPLKRPWTKMVTPPTHSIPSTFAPSSSSAGGVTLEAIMAQLQRMDTHLDTLTDEMSQVTTCVGHIAQHQVCLGGFVAFPSLSPQALEDEDDDDGSGDDDDDEDEDASSSCEEEMTTSQ